MRLELTVDTTLKRDGDVWEITNITVDTVHVRNTTTGETTWWSKNYIEWADDVEIIERSRPTDNHTNTTPHPD